MNKQEKEIILEAAINNGFGIFPLPSQMYKPLAWLLDTRLRISSGALQSLRLYLHTSIQINGGRG